MRALVVTVLLGFGLLGASSPDHVAPVAGSSPQEALQTLVARLAGDEQAAKVDARSFEGLPEPAPGLTFLVRLSSFDQARMRVAVVVEVHASRGVVARRRYIFPVRTSRTVLVPRHLIRQGSTVRASDLRPMAVELGGRAHEYALDEGGLVGRVARTNILPGRPVAKRALGLPAVVQRGRAVKVQVRVGPMVVSMKGEALADGSVGEAIRVMNPSSSQVLVGTVVGAGLVEVQR